MHNELTLFLDLMKGIITKKRQEVEQKKSFNGADNEKDLLTLMIESEMDGNGAISNDDLLVSLCSIIEETIN